MAAAPDVTTPIASYHHGDFPLEDLKAMKKDRRISVCIPAHDEEATVGAIVVFLDGDVENSVAHFVTGLLGPVLAFAGTMLVKACYRRPFGDSLTGGGRVIELVARPLMSLLFPELSGVVQPLAGEVAVRREARSQVELADGYGVELGMLIDISRRFAVTSIAPVDPDVRTHRNRPLHELAPQARDVPDIALRRAGVQLA